MNIDKIENFYKGKFEEKLKDNEIYTNAKDIIERYAYCMALEWYDPKYRKLTGLTDLFVSKIQFGDFTALSRSFMFRQKYIKNNCDKEKLKLQKKLKKASERKKSTIEKDLADIENDEKYTNAIKYIDEYNYFEQLSKTNKSFIEAAVKDMKNCEKKVITQVMLDNLSSDASNNVLDYVLYYEGSDYLEFKFYGYAKDFFKDQLNKMYKEERQEKINSMNDKILNYINNNENSKDSEEMELN